MYEMKDFIEIIEELIMFLEDTTMVETQKLDAVAAKDIVTLEKCMNAEQVNTMKLRGLDKKREKIQKALSFDGLTFHQILEKVDESYKDEIEGLYKRLDDTLVLYKNTTKSASRIIEANLHALKKKVESAKTDPKAPASGRPAFTSRKA